jgi:hypothetical protein
MIAGTGGVATKLVIPEQHATPVPYGSVEVTREGKSELALALGPDDRYVARIQSHPALAFQSVTDDAKPAITCPGAWTVSAVTVRKRDPDRRRDAEAPDG